MLSFRENGIFHDVTIKMLYSVRSKFES